MHDKYSTLIANQVWHVFRQQNSNNLNTITMENDYEKMKQVRVSSEKKSAEKTFEEIDALLSPGINLDKPSVVKPTKPKVVGVTVNQLAKFIDATTSVKTRITRTAKFPPEESFFWYGKAKSAIPKALLYQDSKYVHDKIGSIDPGSENGDFRKNNARLTKLALQKFLKMSIPIELKNKSLTELKIEKKPFYINGVEVRVNPELLFTCVVNGQEVVGAVKLNLGKTKPFTSIRSKIVARIIQRYLKKNVAKEGQLVLPEYCFCLDVFANTIVSAGKTVGPESKKINDATLEFQKIWNSIN